MNKLIALVFCLATLASCNLEPTSYKSEIATMEDSLFKTFPTVNRVSIEIKNDFGTELIITFGDATLYEAKEEERTMVVNKVKDIALYILGKDKKPNKGTVIFVKEENTIDVDKNNSKTYDMHIKGI